MHDEAIGAHHSGDNDGETPLDENYALVSGWDACPMRDPKRGDGALVTFTIDDGARVFWIPDYLMGHLGRALAAFPCRSGDLDAEIADFETTEQRDDWLDAEESRPSHTFANPWRAIAVLQHKLDELARFVDTDGTDYAKVIAERESARSGAPVDTQCEDCGEKMEQLPPQFACDNPGCASGPF